MHKDTAREASRRQAQELTLAFSYLTLGCAHRLLHSVLWGLQEGRVHDLHPAM